MIPDDFSGWRAPSLLWPRAAQDVHLARLMQPAILRFDSDKFVPELLAILAEKQPDIAPLIARPETKRKQGAGWVEDLEEVEDQTLTLYQVLHGRFYMVAGSLITRALGLPTRPLDQDAKETAFFVVRRLVRLNALRGVDPLDPTTYQEFGWVAGSDGWSWRPVLPQQVLPGEERLPLFELPYTDQGKDRSVHAGIIPVASREQYLARPLLAPDSWPALDWDPRSEMFTQSITKPMHRLPQIADPAAEAQVSTILLMDMIGFLEQHLPVVWQRIQFRTQWAANLKKIWTERERLIAGDPSAPLFDLADAITLSDLAHLTAVVNELLQADAQQRASEPLPRSEIELFTVRLVLERPKSVTAPLLVSESSQAFHLASFNEPDAPERPGAGPLDPVVKALVTALLPKIVK